MNATTLVPSKGREKIMIGEAIFTPSTRTLIAQGQEQRLEPKLADLLETFCAAADVLLVQGAGNVSQISNQLRSDNV